MAEEDSQTVVIWDVNTCPVPDGIDPGVVPQSIISALEEYLRVPCRVTIFAVGNLDNVAANMLKGICSSGIFIKHILFGIIDVDRLVNEVCKKDKHLEKLLLISSNTSWQIRTPLRYPERVLTILRAYPKDAKPLFYNVDHKWVWENLLEVYSRDVPKERMMMDNVESAFSCMVCDDRQFYSHSIDDFIKHLKTDEEHKENHRDSVFTDADDRPYLYCEACKYPGYNKYNMTLHLKSSEHKDILYKTFGACNFCNYSGNDMAIHYNSEKHTQKELAFLLDDERRRKRAAMEQRERELDKGR